jgi:nucleoside-diphosphate-sugar epimerase
VTRIVLFGASGFIGGHVRALLGADARVSSLDCPGRDRVDLTGPPDGRLADLLREARPDAVVCCVGRLNGSGYELVRANTMPAAALLAAVGAAAPEARLIRLGSAAEYGAVPPGRAAREDDVAEPVSEYGLSHLIATRLVELAARADGIRGTTLRVFNPIGPGMTGDTMLGRAAARIAEAVRADRPEVTLGDLSAYRDFVDVRDVAAAVVAAVFAPAVAPAVVNVGSGCAVPARLAVQLLAHQAGYDGRLVEKGAGPARSASVGWMLADLDRAAATLGWVPVFDLGSSVRAVWTAAAARQPTNR